MPGVGYGERMNAFKAKLKVRTYAANSSKTSGAALKGYFPQNTLNSYV